MSIFALAAVALIACALPSKAAGPSPNQIKRLVTFGDSYSDVVMAADNGTAWPVWCAIYGNLTLYPFARSGATCSQTLTPRIFPAIFESQLPTYFAEVANHSISVPPEETVYTLWIGTNDVGVGEIIDGQQNPGVTLVNTVQCKMDWITTLYNSGARNFVMQNASGDMLNLQDVILYQADSYPNRYWTAERNTSEWHIFMTELVASANKLTELMLNGLAPTLPGTHIGLFDSYKLFTDIRDHPAKYLSGTVPFNVTGAISSCVYPLNSNVSAVTPHCTTVEGSAQDSYMWFDEIHPSQRSDWVLAREITAGINNQSSEFLTWLT
ncbi:GDSL lipase/acylhydrolase [Obba rivulosa]|uniref:GDSL lipase/acylhydrolase n=1 Tax=Obba rivulosa TaxID=1052685 RepID=A0A8E2AN52_9APHY|nr:GDSL lipase/acylhydrolase [Obba rivulosa]